MTQKTQSNEMDTRKNPEYTVYSVENSNQDSSPKGSLNGSAPRGQGKNKSRKTASDARSSYLMKSVQDGMPIDLGAAERAKYSLYPSGYAYEPATMHFITDCSLASGHWLDACSKVFEQLALQTTRRINFTGYDIRNYTIFLNEVVRQTAWLAKHITLYKLNNQGDYRVPASLLVEPAGVRSEDVDTSYDSFFNSHVDFRSGQMYSQDLLDVCRQLLAELNNQRTPFAVYLQESFDMLRYVYKDREQGNTCYYSFHPILSTISVLPDGKVLAKKDSDLSWDYSQKIYEHFKELLNLIRNQPSIFITVQSALKNLGGNISLRLPTDLDAWAKFDKSMLAAIHNADIGLLRDYDTDPDDSNYVDLTKPNSASYIGADTDGLYSSGLVVNKQGKSSTIDYFDFRIADRYYTKFKALKSAASMAYMYVPTDFINVAALVYLNSATDSKSVSYLKTTGVRKYQVGNDSTFAIVRTMLQETMVASAMAYAPKMAAVVYYESDGETVFETTYWTWQAFNTTFVSDAAIREIDRQAVIDRIIV